MSQNTASDPLSDLKPNLLMMGASIWFIHEYGPVTSNAWFYGFIPQFVVGEIFQIWAALALLVLVASSANAICAICTFMDYYWCLRAAHTPAGHKGKAVWARWKDITPYVWRFGWCAYWGQYTERTRWRRINKPIFADFESNAVVFGPAGSGKTAGHVLQNCLSIRHSKLIADYKSNLYDMIAQALRALGEIVYLFDIGGKYKDEISDCLNLFTPIINNFAQAGGLASVDNDCAELALRIYKEPPENRGDGFFWRQGSRDPIELAIKQAILLHGENAHIGHVYNYIFNRETFLFEMRWASGRLDDGNGNPLLNPDGTPLTAMPLEHAPWTQHHDADEVERFIKTYRAQCSAMVDVLTSKDTSGQSQSFFKGAQNVLKPFSPSGRAFKLLSHSSFRFHEMKDGIVNVVLAQDAEHAESQQPIMDMLQECAITECKRHPDKRAMVTWIADETTNGKIANLPALLTHLRESSIRLIMYIQSIGAFREVYGQNALNTLMSETEIKIFLPNQRDPEILKMIEAALGNSSYIGASHNGTRDEYGVKGFGLNEQATPLLQAADIRRFAHSILFIRDSKPIAVNLIPYAAISPWHKQVGINSYHKKPWKLKIRLKLGKRKAPFRLRLRWALIRGLKSLFTVNKGGH